ncbi:monovalent cation/H+ antiporter subunit G [Ketogulonicigenium robustum]|uniref:Monovalent cation/H+ antiporter subunit G n=1 Tax=Ketogulonicigenium robustum TaxID=92947 RepID=A0A1W6NXZ7_9RHOB|nr:monovalent cation/H(+) antiporter subunit G [Ketogulonicigenium robustum]ARO14118.1 monovalent cation/H+ antiporter subunit G [Ketogulonicigenium robustum]
MSGDLSLWVAIPVALLVVIGATLTFVGALGLVRLRNFYDRIHAPSLGTSWGTAGVALASLIFFSASAGELLLHELIIGIFIMITTPIGMIMLAGAAYVRDQRETAREADDPEVAPALAAAAAAAATEVAPVVDQVLEKPE